MTVEVRLDDLIQSGNDVEQIGGECERHSHCIRTERKWLHISSVGIGLIFRSYTHW